MAYVMAKNSIDSRTIVREGQTQPLNDHMIAFLFSSLQQALSTHGLCRNARMNRSPWRSASS